MGELSNLVIGKTVDATRNSRYGTGPLEESIAKIIGGQVHNYRAAPYDILFNSHLIDVKMKKPSYKSVSINVSCLAHAFEGNVTDFLVVTPSHEGPEAQIVEAYDFDAFRFIDYFYKNISNVNRSSSRDPIAGLLDSVDTEGKCWPILVNEKSLVQIERASEISKINTMRGPITNFDIYTIPPGTEVEYYGTHFGFFLSNDYLWAPPSLGK